MTAAGGGGRDGGGYPGGGDRAGGTPGERGPTPGVPEPGGFLVTTDSVTRIHILDWGGPADPGSGGPPVVLVHGVAGTAWAWAPVARRLAATRRVVAVDLRGHGLSDAPTDGYSLEDLAADVRAVIEGAGLDPGDGPGPVVAGHGFGAMIAAVLAVGLGPRCSGLVLIDGGWESPGADPEMDREELLRALEEPPDVLRSMADYLADREAFDPASWDADQERAARAAVVELPAGRVVPVARPHVLAGCVDSMLAYRPGATIAAVGAPVSIVLAGEPVTTDAAATGPDRSPVDRRAALEAVVARLATEGRRPRVVHLAGLGHNVMRYRPDEIASVIGRVHQPSGASTSHPGRTIQGS